MATNLACLRTTGKVPAEVWEEQILKHTAQLRRSRSFSMSCMKLVWTASSRG